MAIINVVRWLYVIFNKFNNIGKLAIYKNTGLRLADRTPRIIPIYSNLSLLLGLRYSRSHDGEQSLNSRSSFRFEKL